MKKLLFIILNMFLISTLYGAEARQLDENKPFTCTTLQDDSEKYAGFVRSVNWAPDDSKLASAQDRRIQIWDLEKATCIHILKGHEKVTTADGDWSPSDVNSIRWSPAGTPLSSAACDKTVRIWDPRTAACIHILKGYSYSVDALSWSPDGTQIASGSSEDSYTHGRRALISIWDLRTARCIKELKGSNGHASTLSWSPDGKLIVSGTVPNHPMEATRCLIEVWNPNTEKLLHTFKGPTTWVSSISWLPNETLTFGFGSPFTRPPYYQDSRAMKLWNLNSTQHTRTLEGHRDGVLSVDWSQKASCLTSGSKDHTIKLWNMDTHTCTHTLKGHTSDVTSVRWSPDGLVLASGSRDRRVKLWRVNEIQDDTLVTARPSAPLSTDSVEPLAGMRVTSPSSATRPESFITVAMALLERLTKVQQEHGERQGEGASYLASSAIKELDDYLDTISDVVQLTSLASAVAQKRSEELHETEVHTKWSEVLAHIARRIS